MSRFDNQLSRMQSLINYKMCVNENEDKKVEGKLAADGKSYAIIRECSKYYIKVADADKATIAEAYDYIGGFNNKKDYEYSSHSDAVKNFDLKMMSINEANGKSGNAVTLDPDKKKDFVIEGTEQMKKELARQRQIMENCCKIGRDCQCDPERVSGSNNPDGPYTEKAEAKLDKDMPKANGNPESEGTPYGDGKAPEKGKDVKNSDVPSDGVAVAAEHPSGGKVARVNESAAAELGSVPNGAKDWNAGFNGNGDPKSVKYVDGAETVNENEINGATEWDEGLPNQAGVGNPTETQKHIVDEEEDIPEITDGEDEGFGDEEFNFNGEENEPVDGESMEDEPIDSEDEPMDEPVEDEPMEDEGDVALEDKISELEAEIAAIKAELGFDADEDEPINEPVDDLDDEPIDEPVNGEMEDEPIDGEPFEDEPIDGEDEPMEEPAEDDMDDESYEDELNESKKGFMNSLIESVVKEVLAEETTVLHDFGKHPGYRKKPMSLPQTGTDNDINGARDWNDDSVHSEAPFGQKIGDGKPYDQMVKVIADSVMNALKKKI